MRARGRWLIFIIVALAQLVSLVVRYEPAVQLTQALIAPSLVPLLWTHIRHRTARWAVAALGFSFLGDIGTRLVPQSWAFFAMVVPFWVAQLCYLIAFAPLRHHSALARNPRSAVAYVAICIGVISWALPAAGGLWPIPLIYGISILAMALFATGLGRSGLLGGVSFLFSDGLLAVNTFLPETSNQATRMAVMATYMLAQALLIRGVRLRVTSLARERVPADTGAHS